MRILASLSLFFSLTIAFSADAQISIGIKGGPDFSKLVNAVKGDDGNGNIGTLNSGTVTQYYGGIIVDIPLDTTKMFYIRTGADYTGAGGSMNPTGNYYNANGFTASTKYKLQYVDVPVEFLYSPGFGWGRPWVGLGLYGGALLNGTIKGPGGGSESVKIGNTSDDNFQRFDFGYTFTMGLATKVGFLFGLDYQHGFMRVVSNGVATPNQVKLQTRNSIWGLHLGWMFKL